MEQTKDLQIPEDFMEINPGLKSKKTPNKRTLEFEEKNLTDGK